MTDRERLLNLIVKRSFKYDPDNGFLLSSGKRSDIYIDMKKTALHSEGMLLIGRVGYEAIRNFDFDAIGGLTLGADPIAYSIAHTANRDGRGIDVFIVRKEKKAHGTSRWVEGDIKDKKVFIVEDVTTTGASAIKAIERVREEGGIIVGVLVVVDRQEGGIERIKEKLGDSATVISLFTREELIKRGSL